MATWPVIHHRGEVDSTQSEALRLARSSGEMPLLVVADRQTRGRGRRGRPWRTAPRALACTLATSPPSWPSAVWSVIPLVAGLAARRAIRESCGVEPGLKWPNDLVTSRGKVGGVLVHAATDLVRVGLGANLWWPDPPDGFAAVHDEDPGPTDAPEIARTWAKAVMARLDGEAGHWGRDEYRTACVTLGSSVTWEPGGHGRARDVAADGALIVESASGPVALRSEEVRTVRDATLPAEDPTERPTP